MKSTVALLSVAGMAVAQGVVESIAPPGSYPDGCKKSFDGKMWVSVVSAKGAAKRSLVQERGSECIDGNLVVSLADGVMTDAKGRTGYIASNYQFQFDAPAQAGALFTAGYSLCGNGLLALGPNTTFFQCKSGDFWNLYDRSWAPQCESVQLAAYSCAGSSSGSAAAGQIPDGQVVGTQVVTTTIIKPIADGQPQVVTTVVPVPMCQIADGQVQAHTTPCASATAAPAPPSKPAPAPISQHPDGQIQVTPPPAAPPAPSAPSAPAAPPPAAAPSGPASAPAAPPPSKPSPTAATSAKPSASAPAATTASLSSAPRVHMGSLAALAVGVVCAVIVL